jgi:hypothetical protein
MSEIQHGDHLRSNFEQQLRKYESSAAEQDRLWKVLEGFRLATEVALARMVPEDREVSIPEQENYYRLTKESRQSSGKSRSLTELSKAYGLSDQAFKNIFAGKKILDVGSGKSALAKDLDRDNVETSITSIDINEKRIGEAPPSSQKVIGKATELPFQSGSFDGVVASYSMPLWASSPKEVDKMYEEYLRVLKSGGEIHLLPIIGIAFRQPINSDGRLVGRRVDVGFGESIIEADTRVLYVLNDNQLKLIDILEDVKNQPNLSIVLNTNFDSQEAGGVYPFSAHIKKLS